MTEKIVNVDVGGSALREKSRVTGPKIRATPRPSRLRDLADRLLRESDMRRSSNDAERENWNSRFDDLKRVDARAASRLLGVLEDADTSWQYGEGARDAAVEWIATGREPKVEDVVESAKVTLTEERRSDAMKLLADPALLWRIARAIKRMGVAGEEKASLVLYLVGVSRLLRHPLAATMKADSASGKNYLLSMVNTLFPEEAIKDVTRLSSNALYYMKPDALRHKWLQIVERRGGAGAAESVRWLISEGKLILETVRKDPETGEFETERKVVPGPTAFTATTTESKLDEDDETRNVSLHLDVSPEQTERILHVQATMFDGFRAPSDAEGLVWRDLQRILEETAEVERGGVRESVIPYAQFRADEFPKKAVRAPRDFPRLLEFINAIVFLHQFQRDRTEDGRIVSSPVDYFYGRLLFEEFLARSMKGLPPQTEAILEAARKHFGVRVVTEGAIETTERPTFSRGQLSEKMGWSEFLVRKWIAPLHHTYLRVMEGGQGRAYKYQVVSMNDVGLVLPTWEEVVEFGEGRATSSELRADERTKFPHGENTTEIVTSSGSSDRHMCIFDPIEDRPKCECGLYPSLEVHEVSDSSNTHMEGKTSNDPAHEVRSKPLETLLKEAQEARDAALRRAQDEATREGSS